MMPLPNDMPLISVTNDELSPIKLSGVENLHVNHIWSYLSTLLLTPKQWNS